MLVAIGLFGGGLSAVWVTIPAQMQRGEPISVYALWAPLGVLGAVSALSVCIGLWLSFVSDPGAQLRQE